jgi:hypothetical protein
VEIYDSTEKAWRVARFLPRNLRFREELAKDIIRVSSLYLHANATSHQRALGAIVELLDNAMELLLITSWIPRCLDGVVLDVFMNFIIMFMASPLYAKNPYLRVEMVEFLNAWM